MDKTESGLLQTMELLKDNGIICGGAGKNMEAASQMIILKKESLKIGIMFIAEKELNIASKDLPGAALFDPEMNKLEIIKNRGKVDFLAISVHAGHEFMQDPSPRIRQAYRSFIQAGANIVIGHHPHVVQGIEKYGQGWIFYSLGNLVFDSQYVSGYENTDQGYLSRITAGRNRVLGVEIIPYKMKKCIEVAELAPDELWEWRLWLQKISLLITNDKKFSEAWRKNVKKRWNQDYKELLTSFSCRFENDSDKSFLSWLRNFIQCPTTEEFICASLDLLEEGVLKRKPEEK
jgi:poly-gamma-glutamate synthesis protein (capsule biosynthesis protein)